MIRRTGHEYIDHLRFCVRAGQKLQRTKRKSSYRCAALARIAETETSGWHRLSGAKRGDMSQNKNNADWERLLQAQKATERQLREQKLQLDAALNNTLQGLCMFDAD